MPAVGAEAGGGFLDFDVKVDQHRLNRPHHERNADEDHRHKNADRRERHLDAEFGKRRAEPAVLREQRGQRDAGDRGRQRKGNIDDGVEQPAAREAIAHQRPDDDRSHHEIDQRGGKGEAERNLQGMQGAAAGDDRPELIEAQLERLEEQARERDQDDDREPCQRQSHGETKPRQCAASSRRSRSRCPLPARGQISSCKSGRRCRLRRSVPSAPWSSRRKRRRSVNSSTLANEFSYSLAISGSRGR